MPSFPLVPAVLTLLVAGVALPRAATAQDYPGYDLTCESSGGRKECRAPWSERGVRLVRQLSESPCTQGYTWGYTRHAIWVDKGCRGVFAAGDPVANEGERVNCSSGGPLVRCPAETDQGVTLMRQLSKSPCKRGQTWGYTRDFVWVADGCRAEFRMGGGYNPVEPPDTPLAPPAGYLTCSSPGGLERCPADTRRGVELARQISESPCRRGDSWGYERGYVWVDRGCRADFRLSGGYRPIPPPNGSAGGSGVERVTCQARGESARECALGGSARRVALVREIGERRCKQGKNWGWNPSVIWVAGHCGGVFEVEYR